MASQKGFILCEKYIYCLLADTRDFAHAIPSLARVSFINAEP